MKYQKVILLVIIFLAALLRLINLTSYPAGFNADEAAIGYNAHSILTTGRDEYGTLLPLSFKSFGDYKPGLYFYTVVPFVAILGLNELAVRLPSALFGIGTVILVYFLSKEVFKNRTVGLVSAFLLAIAPWHLHFSRGGWESNAATFLMSLAFWFLLKGLSKQIYLFWTGVSFLASMYMYQSPRLVIPVMVLVLLIIFKKNIFKKSLLKFAAVLFLLSIPLVLQFTSGEGSARFSGLSFLSDPGPTSRVDELRGEHGNLSSYEAKVLHNKPTAYIPNFLGHYLDHFSTQFLFIRGDEVIRNKVPEAGQFFLAESLFLVIGLFALIKDKVAHKKVLCLWILAAPLASSMTFQTPNALRSFSLVIPLTMVMGYGLVTMGTWFYNRWRYIVIVLVSLLLSFEFVHYLESYYVHYPKRYPLSWEYGFREMVSKLDQYEDKYNNVVITDRYDQPYILVLFYKKYDPEKYWPQARLTQRDKFNFGTINGFDKYRFKKIEKEDVRNSKNSLFIGTKDEIPSNIKIIDKVDFLNGEPAFLFAESCDLVLKGPEYQKSTFCEPPTKER